MGITGTEHFGSLLTLSRTIDGPWRARTCGLSLHSIVVSSFPAVPDSSSHPIRPILLTNANMWLQDT